MNQEEEAEDKKRKRKNEMKRLRYAKMSSAKKKKLKEEERRRQRKNYDNNPGPKRQAARESYKKNPEPKRQAERANYCKNPEPKRLAKQANYDKNPEPKRQAARANYDKNPEPKRRAVQANYDKNPEPKRLAKQANYDKNPEPKRQAERESYAKNKDTRLFAKRQAHAKKVTREEKEALQTRVNFTNTEPHHILSMDPGSGADRHFKDHQNCPQANTYLNHITTYQNHFIGDPKDPKELEVLKKQIEGQEITPKKRKELAEKFLYEQGRGCKWSTIKKEFVDGSSRDAPIYSCASCGFRAIDLLDPKRHSYELVSLADMECLKLNENQTRDHLSRIQDLTVNMPSDKNGHMKKFYLWRAWSIWPHQEKLMKKQKYFYHLHPELVELHHDKTNGALYKARICHSCCSNIKKNKIPPLSIASGVDFGSYMRAGLVQPSLMERHIISKVRHFSQVVKIESNSTRQREHTQSCIKGNCIAFDHDAPKVCVDLLSQDNMLQDICIHFVGPDGSHDTLLQKTRSTQSSHIFARAHVVYQWLSSLKKINTLYTNEPELPPYDQFKNILDNTAEILLEKSLVTEDSEAISRTEIARDDVAGIRYTSHQDQPIITSDEGIPGDSNEISLRHSYLTNSDKTEFDSHTDTTHEFLVDAANTVGVDVDIEREQYKRAKSRRSAYPTNEFSPDDISFLGGWPDIFLLGKRYGRGTLTDRETSHLLMQFTNAAAGCQLLLFYLFDRKQRHSTINNMAARVKQDPGAFEQFTKMFMSKEFQHQLQKSVANPECKEAKSVLNKLIPVMTSGSKKTSFGALERKSAAGEILAMGRKYGPASNFLTASVDDINSPLVFRMAFRSCNNINFPAHSPDSLLHAMGMGEHFECSNEGECIHGSNCIGSGNVSIPCGWSSLAKSATNNPVSVAYHYNKLIYDLMTILVGIKPGTTSGNNNRTVKTEYRGWGTDSLGIIVGTPAAFIGVTETTGKGSLHFHVGKMYVEYIILMYYCHSIYSSIISSLHSKYYHLK